MRFRSRHVQQTLSDFIREGITGLGWIQQASEDRVFGLEEDVRVIDVDPDEVATDDPEETKALRKRLAGTVLAVSIETEDEDLVAELGGGLYRVGMPTVVDIWSDRTSVAMSLASDVKGLLRDQHIPVRDYANEGVEVEGSYIEPVYVSIERPSGNVIGIDFKKRWRIVAFDSLVWFQDGS